MPFFPGSTATIRVDIEGEKPTRMPVREIDNNSLACVAKGRQVRSVTLTARGLDAEDFDTFDDLLEFEKSTESELVEVTIDVKTNPPTAPRTPRGTLDPSAPTQRSSRVQNYFAMVAVVVALLAVVCGAWPQSHFKWDGSRFKREYTVTNAGRYEGGCRPVENLTATVAHPNDTTVALSTLAIGDQKFTVEACPSTGEACNTKYVFKDRTLRLTQNPSVGGKRSFVLVGSVGCPVNASLTHHGGKVALHDRVMTFQLSGRELKSRTEAHVRVVASQGEMIQDVPDSHVTFDKLTSTAVVRSSLTPEVDALLLRNGGEFGVNSSCPPIVHASTAAAPKEGELQLCINVAVDKRCHEGGHSPKVRPVDVATGLFAIKHQRKLPHGCDEVELGSEVPGTHASVGYVVVLGAPHKRDAPAHFRMPLVVGDTMVSVEVEGHRLWSKPGTPLHVNVMGPAYAGKSNECGLRYCYNVPLRTLETANECLRSNLNRFERGQNDQFTFTTQRVTQCDKLGGLTSDNVGTQPVNRTKKEVFDALPKKEADTIPDERSLRNYMNGHCPDDCSAGECREEKCNSNGTRTCADVELLVLPVDSVFYDESVGSPKHPLYYEHQSLKWVRQKEVHCRQPVVLLVNVKAAFDNIPASKVIADPAISMRSTLYGEAELELCSKARKVLHANEGTQCVAKAIRAPERDMTRAEYGRYLEGSRALDKALHAATKNNVDKKAAFAP